MIAPSSSVIDPGDILAHLFFATGTRDEVSVTSASGEFTGRLQDPVGDAVVVAQWGSPPVLPAGTPVCIEHTGPEETYHFYSEVMAIEAGGVRVRLPHAIEYTEKRACERLVLPPGAGFGFRPQGPAGTVFAVYDLSAGGLAFEHAAGPTVAVGQRLEGELIVPGGPPLRLGVEVRHVQVRREERVVGVRIDAIDWTDRGRLANVLATWAG